MEGSTVHSLQQQFFYRRGLLQRCSVRRRVLCIVSEEIILLFKIQTFGIFPELQVWAHSRYCLSAVLLLQQLHLQFWAHSPFLEIQSITSCIPHMGISTGSTVPNPTTRYRTGTQRNHLQQKRERANNEKIYLEMWDHQRIKKYIKIIIQLH